MNRSKESQRIIEDQVGYFGIGILNPKIEPNLGVLMRSALCFGASFVFTIGKKYKRQCTDTCDTQGQIPLFFYPDFDDFVDNGIPRGCQLIGTEITDNSQKLPKFVHPKRCIYLLGAEDNGIHQKAQEACQYIVEIPTQMCLNVATAGSVLMYDRIAKG